MTSIFKNFLKTNEQVLEYDTRSHKIHMQIRFGKDKWSSPPDKEQGTIILFTQKENK